MAFWRSAQGIGRGEIAESRIEAPFIAAFMLLCAVLLLLVHTFVGNTSITIALALSMIVFGVTVVRVDMGVAILLLSMLLSPEVDFGTEFSGRHELNVRYDDILIIVIFLGTLVKIAFDGRQTFWRGSPVNAGIVAYYLICIISTLLAVRANLPAWDRRAAFFVMLKMVEFYMIFYLVGNAVRDLRDLRKQLTLFFIVALVVCTYCALMIGRVERIGTPFEAQGSEPNTLGGYLMIVMCVAIGLFTQARATRHRVLFLGIGALAFLPFLYTLSRASYMALLVALISLGVLGRKWYVLAALALVLVLSPFVMPAGVLERVNYTFQQGTGEEITIGGREVGLQVDKSTHERVYVWQKVWFIMHVAPWFGGGVAWETVLDSQYARVIMETGLIGLAAFLFLQYRLFKTARQASRWSPDWVGRGLALGMAAATLGLVTHSLGTISFLIVRIMEPYWFLMALVVIVRLTAIEWHTQRLAEARQKAAHTPAPEALPPAASLAPYHPKIPGQIPNNTAARTAPAS